MTEPIAITEDLLTHIWRQQMDHTRDTIKHSLSYLSDDGYDYLDAALTLSQTLSMLYFERDLENFGKLINTPMPEGWLTSDEYPQYEFWTNFQKDTGFEHLAALACDGVCPALYELNCPALPKEED